MVAHFYSLSRRVAFRPCVISSHQPIERMSFFCSQGHLRTSYLMSWVDIFAEKLLKLDEVLINGNNGIKGEKEMCTSCSYQINA